jgi:hypothetical protein
MGGIDTAIDERDTDACSSADIQALGIEIG